MTGAATSVATGGDALARQLAREGVTQIFGVPGVQLDWAIDGLARLDGSITFRTTRHEQGAAYMADGWARATGDVGVCMVVPGPGVLNTFAALSTAWACSSPVLCICGQIPLPLLGRNLGILHDLPDQSGMLARLTKWHGLARTPREIPMLVHEAMRQARGGRPRPVAIEVPPDVLQAAAEVALVDGGAGPDVPLPDATLVVEAAALLARAERPVIWAGAGVLRAAAWDELRQLAERLQAPVVMSENGRGALSDRHPLALTSLAGRALLPHADVVLVVGSRFIAGSGRPIGHGRHTTFVYLNADRADMLAPRPTGLVLHGDAKGGLAALDGLLPGRVRAPRASDVLAVRGWAEAQLEPLAPQRSWVAALRAALPDDGILVTELTQVSYVAQLAFPVYEPRTFVTPGYQGTLGYGFATGLGVAAARPDRAVVSLTGDGGFGWNMQELATAARYGFPLVTVLFNDSAFGNVKRSQKARFGGRIFGSELTNPDFPAVARAFGVDAASALTPDALENALRSALAARRPALIEVPVGEMRTPWHLIHDFVPPPAPPPPNPLGDPGEAS